MGTFRQTGEETMPAHNQIPTKEKKIKGNIWKYGVGNGKSTSDNISFEHPATFPEQLAADHIYSWSNEGNLIYDPFTGSGTTLKMAHLQKRNWIGSEISEEYSALAQKRIAPYLTVQTMF
jgi:site-specific DNA-methyltransferase (adenine-specific)